MGTIYVGIMGTQGRKDELDCLDKDIWQEMIRQATLVIEKIKKTHPDNKIMLLAKGAPWASHLAVILYLNKNVDNLKLFLPVDIIDGKFKEDTFGKKWSSGKSLNFNYGMFGRVVNIWPLKDILGAIEQGAEIITNEHGGALGVQKETRDFLLAITTGEALTSRTSKVADPEWIDRLNAGLYNDESAEVWEKCSATTKIHIPIRWMKRKLDKINSAKEHLKKG